LVCRLDLVGVDGGAMMSHPRQKESIRSAARAEARLVWVKASLTTAGTEPCAEGPGGAAARGRAPKGSRPPVVESDAQSLSRRRGR